MRIFGMSGVPCSGKTTVMRHVISRLGQGKIQKIGILVYQLHESSKCIVLGSYAKAEFGGTDRLSMAVQPVALGVIQAWASDPNMKDWTILFEGDRLFNSSFIESLNKIDGLKCVFVMLHASEKTQKERHKDRGDTQPETWLKGRITKSKRLQESVEGLTVLKNESLEDLDTNVDWVLHIIGLKDK